MMAEKLLYYACHKIACKFSQTFFLGALHVDMTFLSDSSICTSMSCANVLPFAYHSVKVVPMRPMTFSILKWRKVGTKEKHTSAAPKASS